MNYNINDKNKEKAFEKFADSIYKERILAKVMNYNFKILLEVWKGNIIKAKELEFDKYKFASKVRDFLIKYCAYCNKQIKLLFEERKTFDKNNKEEYDNNSKLILFYENQKKYYENDFVHLLSASLCCVDKGKVVPFDKLGDKVLQNVEYESAFDVYLNLRNINVLGHDLADIYYRSLIIKHDMPIFMTKKEYEKYNQIIMLNGRDVKRYPQLTDMQDLRMVYNKTEEIEKQLYESVFPEFGFKYEDRDKEPQIMEVEFRW